MSNEQLVIHIKAGIDVSENMEQLYVQVKSFIHAIAWGYRGMGEIEDLEQEGYLALYPAIDGFDPATGYKFLTYAEYHIRQQMRRYIQINGSCFRLPVHCLEKIQKYNRFCQSFLQECGRNPTDREAGTYLRLTLEEIRDLKKNACMTALGSLEAPIRGIDGGEDVTVGELVASPSSMENEVIERQQEKQLKAELWACVDSLSGEQPAVIRKRYQKGLTFREIGEAYRITPERVRQIESKALQELRKPKYEKRLRPFLPEQVYSMVLYGAGVNSFHRTWTSSTEKAVLWLEEQEARRQAHQELLQKVRDKLVNYRKN